MSNFLSETSHRAYPLPEKPWAMRQTWYNLLFAHWPIPPAAMKRLLPAGLELDTYDGQAWVGVVPFGMSKVYPRNTFPVPWLSYFLELNVRTYVKRGDKPGVFFFSLDAANPLAVSIARSWYQLPYFNARMKLKQTKDGWLAYASRRTHAGAPAAEFKGRYKPVGQPYKSVRGALDYWLTERYCLYTVSEGQVLRGEIHHVQWPLQLAEAEIELNTMAHAAGLELPRTPPILHFAREIDVAAWTLEPLANWEK